MWVPVLFVFVASKRGHNGALQRFYVEMRSTRLTRSKPQGCTEYFLVGNTECKQKLFIYNKTHLRSVKVTTRKLAQARTIILHKYLKWLIKKKSLFFLNIY